MTMSEGGSKIKRFFWYALYGTVVCGALLYFRFPAADLERYLSRRLTALQPGIAFSAGAIRPWLPPGLRVAEARVFRRATPEPPLVHIETLLLRPELAAVFEGNLELRYSGRAYEGTFSGSLLPDGEPEGGYAATLSLADLELAGVKALPELLGYRLSGRLTGTVELSAISPGRAVGEGKAELHLAGGKFELPEALFGLKAIDLREAVVELLLSGGTVQLEHADVKGRELSAVLSGTVRLHENPLMSTLDLQGTFEPHAGFLAGNPDAAEALRMFRQRASKGKFSFTVRGTLDEPEITLL